MMIVTSQILRNAPRLVRGAPRVEWVAQSNSRGSALCLAVCQSVAFICPQTVSYTVAAVKDTRRGSVLSLFTVLGGGVEAGAPNFFIEHYMLLNYG